MQDLVALASLLREISFGVLIAGLFYTFGMFFLGRVFSAFTEHAHEVEHDVDHDVDHSVEHGETEHEVDHSVEHEVEHDFEHGAEQELDHDVSHVVEHDIDHGGEHELDHDVSHEVEHDIDHDVSHEAEHDVEHADHGVDHQDISQDTEHVTDHDVDIDHDIEHDHSGFFEAERGAPLGVTIGTTLVTFGFLGSVMYYEGIALPFIGKIILHVGGTALLVWTMRTILSKFFVETGFNIKPRHIVGLEVEAASTIRDDFGEIRVHTDMGLRRFNARPFQKGVVFQKGILLYAVSADDKFIYVDPRKEVVKWVQKQSRRKDEEEKSKE
ncbi:MAG: hypothetical protein C4K48_11765 [Candidatus Thorarchaeota archaeon]|nr:MAG: hypothetical protein C4K48_11765 [Candidatus Thorarchaeota archaeon]